MNRDKKRKKTGLKLRKFHTIARQSGNKGVFQDGRGRYLSQPLKIDLPDITISLIAAPF
jgi:hypothetical protein